MSLMLRMCSQSHRRIFKRIRNTFTTIKPEEVRSNGLNPEAVIKMEGKWIRGWLMHQIRACKWNGGGINHTLGIFVKYSIKKKTTTLLWEHCRLKRRHCVRKSARKHFAVRRYFTYNMGEDSFFSSLIWLGKLIKRFIPTSFLIGWFTVTSDHHPKPSSIKRIKTRTRPHFSLSGCSRWFCCPISRNSRERRIIFSLSPLYCLRFDFTFNDECLLNRNALYAALWCVCWFIYLSEIDIHVH